METNKEYDVIVIGGGTAGVIAAVQAGRAGVKTLLVEKTGMLGGTITMAGVDFPGLFHAWGKQVIAGIGWELVSQTVEEAGGTLPDFSDYGGAHNHLQVRVNPFIYAALCEEAMDEANVDILFHAMLGDIEEKDSKGWRLTICTKTGMKELTASVVIDCTGDANAATLAGLPVNIPEENQPATLSCRVSGYKMTDLDTDAINAAMDKEVEAGRMSYTDAGWVTTESRANHWLGNHGDNCNHIHDINARDSEGKTLLELASRKSLLRLYRFLRTQPGLENLQIDYVYPECGVRETATIRGKATVTLDDYVSGRVWDDALCYSFYKIDLHVSKGRGLEQQSLEEDNVPTVPRGALLPEGSTNFLVAGRCLSSDRLANSALRVEATCMATGQAAGAMAALSARQGVDPAELSIQEIRDLLRKHGAIVPGDDC